MLHIWSEESGILYSILMSALDRSRKYSQFSPWDQPVGRIPAKSYLLSVNNERHQVRASGIVLRNKLVQEGLFLAEVRLFVRLPGVGLRHVRGAGQRA